MKKCAIDGKTVGNLEQIHQILAGDLALPTWYGGNLDGLYDCLTEPVDRTLELYHLDALKEALGKGGDRLLRCLKDAARENPRFVLRLGRRSIDLETWSRREQYALFSHSANPQYSVAFPLDVTPVYRYGKERGLSFYYAMTWLCTRAANAVPALRTSFDRGEPVLLDRRVPSFIDLQRGSDALKIVTMEMEPTLEAFCAAAKAQSERQTTLFGAEERDDALYISCLPWVPFTALTNENSGDRDDAYPRVAWGKYLEQNGRKVLTVSLEVNHRLVDGYHIGQFYEAFCREIEKLED